MENKCFFKRWAFSLACTMFGIAFMYSSALGQFGNLQTSFGLYPQSFSTYGSPSGSLSFGSSPYQAPQAFQAPSYGAVSVNPFSSFSSGSSLYGSSSFSLSTQPFGYQTTLSTSYPGASGLYGGIPSSGGFSSGFTSPVLVNTGLGLTTTPTFSSSTPTFSSSFFGTPFSTSISSSSWQVPVAVNLGQSYASGGGLLASSFGSPAFNVANNSGYQLPAAWSTSPVYGSRTATSLSSPFTPAGTGMTGSYPLSGYNTAGSIMPGSFPAATTFGQTGFGTASWLPSSSFLPANSFQYPGTSYTSSPYVSSPYVSSPYVSSPYVSSPYGSSPYGSSPYGTSPYGSSSPQGSSSARVDNTPGLAALWQGTYTFYNKDIEEEGKGLVNLQLTQGTNKSELTGYMTVTDWEVVDEKKRGRVFGSVTYSGYNNDIDFVSIVVKFYPELENNEEPTVDSNCYVWLFSGSFQVNMLQCSLYVGGPDDYCKSGIITLARETGN
jgi:hypothetical protein